MSARRIQIDPLPNSGWGLRGSGLDRPWACPTQTQLRDGLLLLGVGGLGFGGVANLLILLLETVDAAFGIDQLLFAGEERVATGADFYADVAFMRGAGAELMSAGAGYIHFFVGGVDTGFHGEALNFPWEISSYHSSPARPSPGELHAI